MLAVMATSNATKTPNAGPAPASIQRPTTPAWSAPPLVTAARTATTCLRSAPTAKDPTPLMTQDAPQEWPLPVPPTPHPKAAACFTATPPLTTPVTPTKQCFYEGTTHQTHQNTTTQYKPQPPSLPCDSKCHGKFSSWKKCVGGCCSGPRGQKL